MERNSTEVNDRPSSSITNNTNISVSRITATSHNTNSELTLDIAPELYALAPEETFTLALAKSLVQEELDVNGEDEDEDAPKKVKRELWRSEDQGLAADYEYVMYGKVSFFSCMMRDQADGQGVQV
jgi:DNA-directed RNA polymerase I, II, and III subunit RPABC3